MVIKPQQTIEQHKKFVAKPKSCMPVGALKIICTNKIENDCIWVIFKKDGLAFPTLPQLAYIKVVFNERVIL